MRIRWTVRALQSLRESTEYIREANPAKAHEVITEIQKSVENLATFPKMGVETAFTGTRDLIHSRYDFLIRYRLNRDLVEVVLVWHASQDDR